MEPENEVFLSLVISYKDGQHIHELLQYLQEEKLRKKIQVIIVSLEEVSFDTAKYKNLVTDIVIVDSFRHSDIYLACKKLIKGTHVSFVSEAVCYDKGAFQKAEAVAINSPKSLISFSPVFIDPNGNHIPYTISPQQNQDFDVNVFTDPINTQLYLPAFLLPVSTVKKIKFSDCIAASQDKDFLLRCFCKKSKYKYIGSKCMYYYESEEDQFATNMVQYEKDWYIKDFEEFLIPMAQRISETANLYEKDFLEIHVMYLLSCRYLCNMNDRNKKVLNDEELEYFVKLTGEVLKHISMRRIAAKKQNYMISRSLVFYFQKLRCEALGLKFAIREDGKSFTVAPQGEEDGLSHVYRFSQMKTERIIISAINYRKGMLEIDFRTTLIDFLDPSDIKFKVLYNNQEAKLESVHCYDLIKCFGKTFLHRLQYKAFIPVNEVPLKIGFYFINNNKKYLQRCLFQTAAARLTQKFRNSYWMFDTNKALVHNGTKFLKVVKMSKPKQIFREIKLFFNMYHNLKNEKNPREAKKMIYTRMLYHLCKPFYKKKRIWVSFDKLFKAGDNGEYMYHYLKNNDLGITPYYIVNEDSVDYTRLKNAGENVLKTHSLKARLVCLYSEMILATHTTVWAYCGFNANERTYMLDLFHAKIACIQHGLTVQKIAQYQNRLFDNTLFYCCASKYEVENILQPIYGYKPEEVVLTGLARYDGLKNNDQKQILITPTWRRDLVNNGIAFVKKSHNNHFKNSEYFRVYNNLINNDKLIASAKKNGYKIIYLLHPAMSSQSVDFDRNEYVEIMEATGDMSYEKILTESSLMVTDYSGVQFDFAYMRKPVVYYHPEELPPFYEEGVFKYDTMGFGEICSKQSVLVDTLCEYMDHNCQCKDEYKKRADDFFAFDDFNSCERIYHAVEKFLESEKEV